MSTPMRHPVPRPMPSVTPFEAASRAAAFAADYLSWDQDDPAGRGAALAGHVVGPRDERRLAECGWSGRGRQRVLTAVPGRIERINAKRVLVHVHVQVSPYVRDADAAARGPHQSRERTTRWFELTVPLVPHEQVDRGERWTVDVSTVWVVPPAPAEHIVRQET